MYCEKLPYNLIVNPINVWNTATFACKPGRKTSATNKSAIDGEPVIHVGQDKLFPKGNCIEKFGCTVCTRWEDCESCDQYKGISKRKRKRKKSTENEIISDVEKLLLKQFRQQDKWQSNFDDFGPIGGKN